MPSFMFETPLDAKVELLSQDLLNMKGVNYELSPIVRMTVPRDWAYERLSNWPVDKELFVSVVLLLGVLPVDLHFFRMSEAGCYGFQENSASLMNRTWMHNRRIEAIGGASKVIDIVEYQSRMPFLAVVMMPLYKFIFAHRHAKLVAKYGRGRIAR